MFNSPSGQGNADDDIAIVRRPAAQASLVAPPPNQNAAPQQGNLELQVTPTFEYAECKFNEESNNMFMASIKAPKYESDAQASRAPLDIVCIIDKSGSMRGQKIELVKKSLIFMVEQLKPEDRISIIGFDTNVYTDLTLTLLNSAGKSKAKQVISSLKPGSSTNLSGGLLEAFKLVKTRSAPKNDVVSCLLFTDGLANVGLKSTAEIVPIVEKEIQEIGSACTIFSFGFGQDTDANMLRGISDAGHGLYYFIEKEDEIPEAFANCLGGLMSVVAQNIKLQVETLDNCLIQKVLSSYKFQQLSQNKYEIQIGDLYSEEERDFILQLKLPALEAPNEHFCPLKCSLSYFDVISTCLKSVNVPVELKRVEILSMEGSVNVKLDAQRNRIVCADALDNARKIADEGNLEEARKLVQGAIESIKKSVSAGEEFCKALVEDLEECLDNMQDHRSYTSIGNKMMNTFSDANKKQRSAMTKAKSQQAYQSSAKSAMIAKSVNIFKK